MQDADPEPSSPLRPAPSGAAEAAQGHDPAHPPEPPLAERIAEARRRREALAGGPVRPGRRGVAGSLPRPPRPKPTGRLSARTYRTRFWHRRPWPPALLGFALGAGAAALALSWPASPTSPAVAGSAPTIREAPAAIALAPPPPAAPGMAAGPQPSDPPAPLLSPPEAPELPEAAPFPIASAPVPPRANPHPDLFRFPLGREDLERLEAALDLGRADRRDVQLRLRVAGFPPGALDGSFGPRTRAALEDWQRARGHHASGLLNAASLGALRAETQEAAAAERRRLAALRAAQASEPSPRDRPQPDRTDDACARDEAGRVEAGRSFRCDVVFLREDLTALFD